MSVRSVLLLLTASACGLPVAVPVSGSSDPTPPPAVVEPECDRITVYDDADADGFGDATTAALECEAGPGQVEVADDCDDTDATVNPASIEVCDGVDQDCNGTIDDAAVDATEWYTDRDGDGWGSTLLFISCTGASGLTDQPGDCDDLDATVNPDAVDVPCDGIDADCDGSLGGAANIGSTGYATVQSALDAAPAGATVTICPGTYNESLEVTRSVTLEGSTGDPVDVTIAPRSGQALVGGAPEIHLYGLTFSGGTAGYDGGNVSLDTQATRVQHCIFEDGYAGYEGGGLAWFGSRTTTPTLEIRDSIFRDNEADYSGGGLTAASRAAYQVVLDGVDFKDNTSGYEGGGASLDTLDREATDVVEMSLTDVSFVDNEAGYSGGGLSVGGWRTTLLTVQDARFEGNVSENEGGGASVGGWSPTYATFQDSTWIHNRSARGAALHLGSWADDTLELTSCRIEDHTCSGCDAVAVGGWGGADVTVLDSTFTDNDGGLVIGGRGDVYVLASSGSVYEDLRGAAVSVAGAASFDGDTVQRNASGLSVLGDLTLTRVDLASGADDNVAWDVRAPGTSDFYSGVTTLTCTSGVCTP